MAVGAGEGDILSTILTYVWYLSFFVFVIYGQKIQTWMMLREVGGAVNRLKVLRDDARQMAIKAVREVGKEGEDVTPRIDHFMEYFTTLPASLDPAGIVPKIDHVIDVRDQRFKDEIALIAPQADEVAISNLGGVIEVALGLNFIYRIVRHFYLLGKKTMSLYVIMQIQMQLPIIMQLAEAYFGAITAFANGQPIGDGAGALVAAKLMYGREKRKIAQDIVACEVPMDERRVLVLKAEGPGANVGKPGDGIRRLIEECDGEVSMVVMVDAASKFEGEKSGETAEGIGTAIGGIGVDQFKIEEAVTSRKIPVNAVIIKESLKDAVTPMKREIYDGVEVALARVRRLIHERTEKGSTVIVAGIGNTVGIGQ